MQRAGVAAEILLGGGELGQALDGHADSLQPSAHQVSQHGQAAVFVFPGGTLDGAQHIVPGRKHRRRDPQGVQVGGKAGGFGLAGGNNAQRPPQFPAERRIYLGATGTGQPEQRAGSLAGQRADELFMFLRLLKKFVKHTSDLFSKAVKSAAVALLRRGVYPKIPAATAAARIRNQTVRSALPRPQWLQRFWASLSLPSMIRRQAVSISG